MEDNGGFVDFGPSDTSDTYVITMAFQKPWASCSSLTICSVMISEDVDWPPLSMIALDSCSHPSAVPPHLLLLQDGNRRSRYRCGLRSRSLASLHRFIPASFLEILGLSLYEVGDGMQ